MLKNKLFLITLGLIILGILTVYSTTTSYCYFRYYFDSKLYLFKKHLVYLAVGIMLMFLFSKIDYNILKRFSNWILIASLILLALTLTPGFSYEVMGTKRYLQFLGFIFRPSELLKIAIIIFFANILSKEATIRTYLKIIIVLSTSSIILFLHPDFGIFIVISLIFLTILFSSEIKSKKVMLYSILVIIILIFSYFIYLDSYSLYSFSNRLHTFINPWRDSRDTSYQTVQSLIAIGSHGLFGSGFNHSIQKWDYLPASYTDFAFSIFCEEFGIIGVACLFLLYLGFLHQGVKIVNQTSDNFAKLLVIGIISQILWQTVINIASCTNTIPIIATSLPFISYSGSSIVFTLIGIGILLNVDHSFKNLSEVENEK